MWTLVNGIVTPRGTYKAKSDDLVAEVKAAAKFAGLESFNVKIDGVYVDTPADLTKANMSEVGTVSVEPYDAAGI